MKLKDIHELLKKVKYDPIIQIHYADCAKAAVVKFTWYIDHQRYGWSYRITPSTSLILDFETICHMANKRINEILGNNLPSVNNTLEIWTVLSPNDKGYPCWTASVTKVLEDGKTVEFKVLNGGWSGSLDVESQEVRIHKTGRTVPIVKYKIL